jgi:hypothetical protein
MAQARQRVRRTGQFVEDVIRHDRSTSVVCRLHIRESGLAKHYGMPRIRGKPTMGRGVDATRYGRGGPLPMALTQNAPGWDSPVKRGYWVVRRVLGGHPPAHRARIATR